MMTEQEKRIKANEIKRLFCEGEHSDQEILTQIKENKELLNTILPADTNLFMEAINCDRIELAKELVTMGADIQVRSKGSSIMGNSLNAACSDEAVDYLLELGLIVERNLSAREDYINPLIVSVMRNDVTMTLYWFHKEKEMFREEETYLSELLQEMMHWIVIMNQYNMLEAVIQEEELYMFLKKQYSKEDDLDSIKLNLRGVKQIKDVSLESKKKELKDILSARRKELKRGGNV